MRRQLLIIDRVTSFSVLRRVTPYRTDAGCHRGKPIDRYYIEAFLAQHKDSIRGAVLEINDDDYTVLFGEARVVRSDVLDINKENPRITIAADLTNCKEIEDETFDCIICTQTLQLIYDFRAAIFNLRRILKPGGVLLATFPGIAPLNAPAMIAGGGDNYWRFTSQSARRFFGEAFGEPAVEVQSFGNALSAVAFLHGLVVPELTEEEFNHHDPHYDVIVGVIARRFNDKT